MFLDPGAARRPTAPVRGPRDRSREFGHQWLGRTTSNDHVGDGVRVTLVTVARHSKTSRQTDARALLDDVAGLVRGRVERRWTRGKCHSIAESEPIGTEISIGRGPGWPGMRLEGADVDGAEGLLNCFEMRERCL